MSELIIDDVRVGVWELIFYLSPRVFSLFVKGDVIGSMLQLVWRVRLFVYLSIFVTNRRALFWAICNLCFVGRVRELRGTDGYMKAGKMVVL